MHAVERSGLLPITRRQRAQFRSEVRNRIAPETIGAFMINSGYVLLNNDAVVGEPGLAAVELQAHTVQFDETGHIIRLFRSFAVAPRRDEKWSRYHERTTTQQINQPAQTFSSATVPPELKQLAKNMHPGYALATQFGETTFTAARLDNALQLLEQCTPETRAAFEINPDIVGRA